MKLHHLQLGAKAQTLHDLTEALGKPMAEPELESGFSFCRSLEA